MSTRVYEIVTENIMAQLAEGEIPWQKPWKGGGQTPRNWKSKKAYRGLNVFILAWAGYSSPYWLSFKQVGEAGGKVKKGEHGQMVTFWKWLDSKDQFQQNGKAKKIPLLRYYKVFNADQCEGLPAEAYGITDGSLEFKPIDRAEEIVTNYQTMPELRSGEARAYYSPKFDYINMPKKELFKSVENYYSTLFHEMTHSSGHEKRLARKGITEIGRFGDVVYSKEELVAEFGATFLCSICGIENRTINNSTAYIQGWLKTLKNDSRLIVFAAAAAQKAADYIQGIKFGEQAAEVVEDEKS